MKYDILGTPLPVVTCTLEAGEQMITERGSMSWMTPQHEDGDHQQRRRRQSLWPPSGR